MAVVTVTMTAYRDGKNSEAEIGRESYLIRAERLAED